MLKLDIRSGESTIWFGTPRWSNVLDEPLTQTQVHARLSGARICLLLHGYRNQSDNAESTYAKFVDNLEAIGNNPYDIMVGCYMPLSRFLLGFRLARRRAAKAGQIIHSALSGLQYASLDISTHSLGGMVALEAIRDGLHCRHLVMAAPAVEDDDLEPNSRYGPYVYRVSGKILVGYSRHDPVGWPFRFATWDRMLGCNGPQQAGALPDAVIAHDFSDLVTSHSGYMECRQYLETWRDLAST